MTIRTASFPATGQGGSAPVEPVAAAADPGISSFAGEELSKSDRPELTSAKIIISGGRAMQSRENFTKYIEPVADRLGAGMGASALAAVVYGTAPNDCGWPDRWWRPELTPVEFPARSSISPVGKDSKVIVAINKDEEAPIFQIADYGLAPTLSSAAELDAELKDQAIEPDTAGAGLTLWRTQSRKSA
jgi:electron transfer flavoprotein alpha subunit